MNVGESVTYNYTGNIQEFTVANSGYYQLECWGGQGGACNSRWGDYASGGQGGYTKTYAKLKKGDKLYIGIGGAGGYSNGATDSGYVSGGYNGGAHGGDSYDWDAHDYNNTGGGGGATHIAKTTNRGTLPNYSSHQDEVIAVAGGGGGGAYRGADSGTTGAYGGGSGGGTTNCGGSGQFGQGAPSGGSGGYPGGGGGGWDGGRSGNWVGTYFRTAYGGTGHYKDATLVIAGVTYTSTTSNGGKSGNGQAKITFIKKGVSIYVGDNEADDCYVGDNEVDTIYVGDNEA